MANNRTRLFGKRVSLVITDGGVAAGDPALCGQLAGVVENAKDANNNAVLVREGVYNLSVKGVNGGGNTAVAQGDKLYYVTGDTPKISEKTTGVFIGWAKGTLTSGSTGTIEVILSGGSGA